MADVVVRGADDLAEHDPVPAERAAGTAGQLRSGEARSRAARPVRADRVGVRVQVGLVGVVDQHEPDRGLVLVDLVDAVHQRDLGRGHIRGAAEVRRVRLVGDEREPVRAQHVTGGRTAAVRRELDGRRRDLLVVAFLELERPVRVLRQVARVVDDVGVVVRLARRVDVPVALRRADRGVEAERADVRANRRGGIVEPATAVGADLGMGTREPRLHDRRVLEREALREAARAGQGEDERRVLRSRRALAWRLSQQRRDRVLVELVGTKLLRLGVGAARRGLRRRRPHGEGRALVRAHRRRDEHPDREREQRSEHPDVPRPARRPSAASTASPCSCPLPCRERASKEPHARSVHPSLSTHGSSRGSLQLFFATYDFV